MAFGQFNKLVPAMRPAGGSYVHGLWVESPAATMSFQASVQPTKPSDLQRLSEGDRIKRSYTLYSKTQILEKDRVAINNEEYEVMNVEVWQNGVIPHYKAIAVKMQKERSL